MEKVAEWVKTCLHKTKMSEGHADTIITKAKAEGKVVLYKYPCPHCFGWHVTKKERNECNKT